MLGLKFEGHVFDARGVHCQCCFGDAKKALSDPTGTLRLRSKIKATLQLRWNALRIMTRKIIVDHDLLQLNAGGLMPVKTPAIVRGGDKLAAFAGWFDQALKQQVLGGDGSVMRPFITQAYMMGVSYAANVMGRRIMSGEAQHREDTIYQLSIVELQGIMDAVSQQAVREVANGLLANRSPMMIVRAIWNRIDKIGATRTKALVDQIVIAAFNQAALDCYEAAKVSLVGIIAEAKQKVKTGDAIQDAPRRKGPGSRISRKKVPSPRTIQRIRAAERRVEALGNVSVRTAGDDDVCPICEGIAEAGPYSIDEARTLIPAHPHCRCTFVPSGDARFAEDKK